MQRQNDKAAKEYKMIKLMTNHVATKPLRHLIMKI